MSVPLARLRSFDDDGVMVITVDGEIDLSNADALLRDMRSRIADGVALVLDLSRVAYLDSLGIAMLDDLRRTMPGVRLVAPAGSPAARLLAMVALGVPIDESRRDAVRRAGDGDG